MCVSACCKCHKLVSEADCKDRYIRFVKFTDFFYNSGTFFRVSRAIAQHDSVWSIFQDLFCRCQCVLAEFMAELLIELLIES